MKNLLILPLVIFLAGCSTPCIQKVAAVEASITTAYRLTGSAHSQNIIGSEDALKAVKAIDGANILSDNARPMCNIDEPKAINYIAQAQVLLVDVYELVGEE